MSLGNIMLKEKKPVTKSHIYIYDSIYMKYPE